jgi:preprotein translocase subunit SecE
MARPTRSQRRARREAQAQSSGAGPGAAQGAAQRARSRQRQVRPGAQPQKAQTGRKEPRERGKFVKESWGELKKVDWPNQKQVITGTVVVLIACGIVGAYLYLADLVFKPLVQQVFL